LLALLLLATALRFGGLGAQELSGDEAFSVLFSERTSAGIIAEILRLGEPHPPLYYLFLHGWMAVAGDSEFSVRFLSAAASILAVALVFVLSRRMFGWRAGLAAATFLTINPFQIWHAQTARMYAISATLALSTTLVLWTALRRGRWWHWMLYSLLTAAHLYLHYYALLVALAQGIWVLLVLHRQWRRLVAFAAASAGVALLYLPWLLRALPGIQAYHGNAESPALLSVLTGSLREFALGTTIRPETSAPFLVTFGLLFVFGLWVAVRSKPREAALLILWLFMPLVGIWIASLRRPLFTVRYLIAASPPFYVLLGLGAARLARMGGWRRVLTGLLGALCLIGTILSLRNYYMAADYARSPGWRELAAYVDTHRTANDVLVQNYPDPSLSYYTREILPLVVVPEHFGASPEQIEEALTSLLDQHARLWLLPYPHPDWDPAGMVGEWLERYADLADQAEPGGIRLQAFLPLRAALEQMAPVEVQLGSGIRLLGYRLEGEAQPGGTLRLTLYWEASGPVQADYTVFTHLLGPGDALLGQMDHPPQNGAAPTSSWETGQRLADRYEIPIRDDTPLGPARLVTGMYDPITGDRLPATGPVDDLDRIYLTEVEIGPAR
jgi:hypothetical protein